MIYKRNFDILKAHRTMGEAKCAIFTYFTHRMKEGGSPEFLKQ